MNDLANVLPATNVITISMTASSTVGKTLDDDELARALEACDVALDLDSSRQKVS